MAESASFLTHFDALPDPRQPGKIIYPLDEVLLLSLLACLAGAETFVDIALFGVKKRELLRRFRPFAAGTPSHDHLGDLFAPLDAECFQCCFAAWVASFTGLPSGVVALDGKTSRRAKSTGKATLHTVSAFAARQRLVLGQTKVAEKSNEIIAIPKLLTMLALEGAIVTLDAMGCQREIAQAILDKQADYVLALKGNQGSLREDVELFAQAQKNRDFANTQVTRHQRVEGDHGRIETRTTTVIHEVGWVQQRHAWPGLKSLVMVESTRELGERIERETRYYLSSLTLPADEQGPMVRDHWAVENSLHWVLDMVFRDDECRVRTANAPANFTTLKHMALNLLRRPNDKLSIRARRKAAGWDDDFLAGLIAL
ncbi:ISAs1 family transposase [Pseudomonas daroniae]|uniref:ISAs1 family transposase n=1 Tax=Phytopseudomonas daroniae TaxID=2487519 RepID=A0A4Q9QL93_9GAMM|nr:MULTISPECIES: ISAs1 family transposase [Pseudomonas]TBU77710.1 ISAs1 family transposase [Pseudomonas daroniae]TBU86161.1 ISAs1 family transposase [Pseudomonas sp. FRB 228]TBU95324.1 ISAs1 family transposase [Pseudomonas daroniae]